MNAQTLSTSVDSVAVRADSTPGRGTRVHVVQRGETLRGLASSYLGDAGRWREIWQRNPSVVRDAAHLEPGTRLLLPTRAPERTSLRMGDGVALFPVSAMGDDHVARFEGRTIFFGEKHTGSGPKLELKVATASRFADTLRAGSFGLRRTSTTLALPV
ncbi:MAG: LysM peptidoglycan-binding domain-containing protein, partial [Gemmatimonadaceae bacterium]|nr:LysM peptidoglycan-binding domain-containing protein [Gemmatimonadaceae bacterium]